jgi:hypothetical protein
MDESEILARMAEQNRKIEEVSTELRLLKAQLSGERLRRRLLQAYTAPPTGSTFTEVDAAGLNIFAAPLDLADTLRVRSAAFGYQKGGGAPGGTVIGYSAAIYRMETRKVFDVADPRASLPRLHFVRRLGTWASALSDGGRIEWSIPGHAIVLDPTRGQFYVAWMTTGQYAQFLCASRHSRGPLVGCSTRSTAAEMGRWPDSLRVASQSGSIGVPVIALRSGLGTRILGGGTRIVGG